MTNHQKSFTENDTTLQNTKAVPMYCSFCDKQIGWWNPKLKELWERVPFTRKACDKHKELI